eukprot:916153_1
MATSKKQVDNEKKEIAEFSKKLGISKDKRKDWVKKHWDQCLVNPGSHNKLILDVRKYDAKIIELKNKWTQKRNTLNAFWGQSKTTRHLLCHKH